MHADYTGLDGLYAAFGKVTDEESLETVDKIASSATNASDRPIEDWVIRTIEVDTRGIEYHVEKIGE